MNQAVNAKEAKDFLVQQTAEQAALENVPLSDLEKGMMYFVENDPMSCSNPLELNSEFEAQYDTREYEAKIGGLLQRAHKRLKAEGTGKVRYWDDAIRTLCKGDHYLPVLLPKKSSGEDGWRSPKNRVIACGSIAVLFFFAAAKLSEIRNIPDWILASLFFLVLLFCLLALGFLAQQGYRALHRDKT